MKFSNKLNVLDFTESIRKSDYVIIKLQTEFPNYYKNSDIDIFCLNIDIVAKKILEIGNIYVKRGF